MMVVVMVVFVPCGKVALVDEVRLVAHIMEITVLGVIIEMDAVKVNVGVETIAVKEVLAVDSEAE